jgi:hypothetical protein
MEIWKHTWMKSKHAICLNSTVHLYTLISPHFAVYILLPKLKYFPKSVMTKLCILMKEPQLNHSPDFIIQCIALSSDKLVQFQKIQSNSGWKFHELNAVQFVLLCVLLLSKILESLLFISHSVYCLCNCLSHAGSFLETTKVCRLGDGHVTTHF